MSLDRCPKSSTRKHCLCPVLKMASLWNGSKSGVGENHERSSRHVVRECRETEVAPRFTAEFAFANRPVPMRRETSLLGGWDQRFESPPLRQGVAANRCDRVKGGARCRE